MNRLLAVLCTVALAPSAGGAQVMEGRVTEQGVGQPVMGAMVRLMADSTWTGVLFLTAADGRFSMKAPGPGRYTLTVERIGFASTTAGPVDLKAGSTLRFDVQVETAPVRLEGLEVAAGRRRCSLADDPGGETQILWTEVHKALDAARWTEREAGLQFQVVRRTRTLDPSGRRILDEQRSTASAYGGNSVRTLPPDELVEGGYMREEDGFIYYYGPDADVLLSDEFLDTHCFSVTGAPEGEPGLVGLAFEPVRGRDLPDIVGVLWVDGATARLERVEFSYTGLGRRPGGDQARGEVRFAELSDGRWIVRDWSVRAPLLGLSRQFVGGVLRERVMVIGVQEQGTEVIWARGKEVEWRADLPWGTVTGTVWDSIAGKGLAGAEVAMGGRSRLTRTDSLGSFALDAVAPGDYWITFNHPLLDSLGVDPAWREVVVEPDGAATVTLAVPGFSSVLALHCSAPGIVVGQVRDAAGAPLAGAVVTAEGAVVSGGVPLSAVTESQGGFWLCAGPEAGLLRVVARLGPFSSAPAEVRPSEVGFTDVALAIELPRSEAVAEASVGRGQAAVVGTVVDAVTKTPIAGALVELVSDDGTVAAQVLSDAQGRVVLLPAESGTYAVRTQRLGYAPSQGTPLDIFRGTHRVEIRLATEAIPLEEMVVTVRGRFPDLERSGFYQREQFGQGLMLDRDAVEALVPSRAGDILRRQPGVTVGPSPRGNTTRRFFVFRRATAAHDTCLPIVYLDGQLVRQGGPISDPDAEERMTLDEIVPAQDIEGMEIYETQAAVPAQFTGPGAACGAVVIWTRRGIGGGGG